MVMYDANYCFTLVHVLNYGKDNDAHIFNESDMGKAFLAKQMNIPSPTEVNNHYLPYVIVSDKIFGLQRWLMKPYPGKGLDEQQAVFNYRLSRCRRTIENCFGILSARWHIFRWPIRAAPETVDGIVKACLCLHNYLRLTENAQYIPTGFVDSEDSSGNINPGDWRNMVQDEEGAFKCTHTGPTFNTSSNKAKDIRDNFKNYFNSKNGSLPWQKSHVNSC
jgi:hypothetical protein